MDRVAVLVLPAPAHAPSRFPEQLLVPTDALDVFLRGSTPVLPSSLMDSGDSLALGRMGGREMRLVLGVSDDDDRLTDVW